MTVKPHNSLCMPIVRMPTEFTSLCNSSGSKKVEDSSPQSAALGLIENPLFERSGGRNVETVEYSYQASGEMSDNSARRQKRSLIEEGLRRSKSVKEYVARGTASFFGLDNETEQSSYRRWSERRRRLLSKRWGEVKEGEIPPLDEGLEFPPVLEPVLSIPRIPEPVERLPSATGTDITDDAQQSALSTSSTNSLNQNANPFSKHKRKDSVYRIMVDSVSTISSTIVKKCSSRKFWSFRSSQTDDTYASSKNDSVFLDENDSGLPSSQQPDSQVADDIFFDQSHTSTSETVQPHEKLASARLYLTSSQTGGPIPNLPRPGSTTWSHSPQQGDLPVSEIGLKRIWNKYADSGFDNFNRRQYGMGVLGKIFHRKIRKDRITSDVKQQLDDLDDHRPFFTYWVTTVQILVTVMSLAVYGFGPFGVKRTHHSGEVMVTSLHLKEVDYYEPDNFWLGPRPKDLVHLGAKFTPCMRNDKNVYDSIRKDRSQERDTACCVRNDQSGCVQTTREKCSKLISSWKKWDVMKPGPPRWMSDPNQIMKDRSGTHRRLSGSVCGQDPRYCHEPASVYPYEWPDDITKWPVCKAVVPSGHKAAEPHMACEIIGRPCCIGVYGQCHITTKEYCDFVKGSFHEEAALCSQVSCLADVCGMIPFHNPEVPDQFYRLWTSLFLHAGILHLLITVIIQYFIMADLEKLVGPVRIGIIYIMSGVGGNLASAIFVPYRAEVGPAGSQFGLLACLFVEVIHCWKMLKHPGWALLRLGGVALVLFLVGLLPWVDNYAHIFGFVFGFLFSYALLPFVSFGIYDRATKIVLIWVCLVIISVLFTGLLLFFYIHPIYECSFCKYLNCIPLTRDFCENHDIVFKRPEY